MNQIGTFRALESARRVAGAAPAHLSGLISNWIDGLDAGETSYVRNLASNISINAHADWAHDGERITVTRLPDGRFAFGIAEFGGDEE